MFLLVSLSCPFAHYAVGCVYLYSSAMGCVYLYSDVKDYSFDPFFISYRVSLPAFKRSLHFVNSVLLTVIKDLSKRNSRRFRPHYSVGPVRHIDVRLKDRNLSFEDNFEQIKSSCSELFDPLIHC